MIARRWLTIGLVSSSLLFASMAGLVWFVGVPNWRPPLRVGEAYGIDVASHQGKINWQAVARDNISFAYIKATEGGDFADRHFTNNWLEAEAVGVDRAAYHFFTLCRSGDQQATHFLSVVPPEPNTLAPAVDLELAGNCAERPTKDKVEAELDTFMRMVEDAWERQLVLYVGDDWDRLYPTRSRLDRPLWQRRILRRPNVDDWVIWQVHGMANIDGIQGPVDLNIMRRSS